MLQLINVFMRIIQNTLSLHAVFCSAARFLVIILYRLWYIIMDNETDIRFINTHSESDGRADHLYIFIQELILSVRTKLTIKAGVISNRFHSVSHKNGSKLFRGLSIQPINNTTLRLHPLNEANNTFVSLRLFDLRLDLIIQVWPVER